MNRTLARSQFKKQFGRTNQYLVTSLVALNCLSSSSIKEAPKELHTTWNPKDKYSTIMRTRIFVQHSFLGWAVDALDMYVSLLNRKPDYLQSKELATSLNAVGHSVRGKAMVIGAFYDINPVTQGLIDVLITWRNNVFHTLAETEVDADSVAIISAEKEYIEANYRGLDANQLSDKAYKADVLTFKETASLINAVHHFVQEVDATVIDRLNISRFCYELVSEELGSKGRNAFAAKYFGLSLERREAFVRNWLANKYGVDLITDADIQAALCIEREPKLRNRRAQTTIP